MERLVDLSWEVAKNCISALLIYLGGVLGGYIVPSWGLTIISAFLALMGVVAGFYFGARAVQTAGEDEEK